LMGKDVSTLLRRNLNPKDIYPPNQRL
jgi:hypothetical protein